MKKIVLVFLFLFCSLFLSKMVYAKESGSITKPLIIMATDNETLDLSYEGYKLVSSNVNLSVIGKYQNIYQSYSDNQLLTKDIYVITEDMIEESDYCINTNEKVLDSDKVIKYHELSKTNYLIVTKEENKSATQEEPTSNLDLLYYENDELKWTKNIEQNCYCSVDDIYVVDDEIYVFGVRHFLYSSADPFIRKFAFDGSFKGIRYISGTGYDYISAVEFKDDSIYIAGYTTSTKGDLKGVREKEDSYIMELNKDTLKTLKTEYIGYPLFDEITEFTFFKDEIYAIQQLVVNDVLSYRILKLNKRFEIKDERILPSGNNQNKIFLEKTKNNLLLIYEDKEQNSQNLATYIYDVNWYLDLNLIDSYIYKHADISLRDALLFDDKIYLDYRGKNKTIYRIFNFLDKKEVAYVLESANTSSQIIGDFRVFEYGKIAKVYDKNIVRVNSFGKDVIKEKTQDIYDYDILLDGKNANLSTKAKLDYDINMFGVYNLFYYLEAEEIEFAYFKDLQVQVNPSIWNNKIYDVKTELTFNGKGLLNGVEIESGHVILDEGKYTLKVIGKSSSVEYEFEIKKLSKEYIEKESENIQINANDFYIENVTTKQVLNVDFEKKEEKRSTKVITWPLAIPTFLGVLATFVLIKGGRA